MQEYKYKPDFPLKISYDLAVILILSKQIILPWHLTLTPTPLKNISFNSKRQVSQGGVNACLTIGLQFSFNIFFL